jgi:hypothetical protein
MANMKNLATAEDKFKQLSITHDMTKKERLQNKKNLFRAILSLNSSNWLVSVPSWSFPPVAALSLFSSIKALTSSSYVTWLQIKIPKQGSLVLHKINISNAAYSRKPCT